MLCSVLLNIDQQIKVIKKFCQVSENIIFSKMADFSKFIFYPFGKFPSVKKNCQKTVKEL